MDDNEIEDLDLCPHCHKDLSKMMNLPNKQLHIDRCLDGLDGTFAEPKSKKKKVVIPKINIKKFFNTVPKAATSSPDPETDPEGNEPEIIIDNDLTSYTPSPDPESEAELIIENDLTSFTIDPQNSSTTMTTNSSQASLNKCMGFSLSTSTSSIYHNFPFQLLDELELVFERNVLHHPSCADNDYYLSQADELVNKECKDLIYSTKLKAIIERAQDNGLVERPCNNRYLTYEQLDKRIKNYRDSRDKLACKNLNAERKLENLGKTLKLHEHFLYLIKENKIHNLHELVNVALRNNRSMTYIISKMTSAVQKLYNPRYSIDDKDLAFLILHYGGPGLLEIVHKAISLPSASTAYRLLQGNKIIKSSTQVTSEEVVDNIKFDEVKNLKYGYMFKVDETYVDKRVKWNAGDNKLYGLCYEHTVNTELDLRFNNLDNALELAKNVSNGTVHVSKEAMVFGMCNNNKNQDSQVVLAWPSCSHSDQKIQGKLIYDVSRKFEEKHGAPLLNWSTDGDGTRRIIFDSFMNNKLSPTSPIYEYLSSLRLLDLDVGPGNETVNFDHKHLAKRIRNCFIGRNFKMGNTLLVPEDIKTLISSVPTSKHGVEALINPADKQNVSLATDFLSTFCEATKLSQKNTIQKLSFRLSGVADELIGLGKVLEGLLSLYAYPSLSIEEQLQKISQAMHILLVLSRELGAFIPNQLYHDLMGTFKDAYFCAAKFKAYHPNEPLYLVLCGNDSLERIFGNMRMKAGHAGFDTLGLIHCSRSISKCQDILNSHPNWLNKGSKIMSRLCLDYSSPHNWDANKLTMQDVDIYEVWNTGRLNAEVFFRSTQHYPLQKCDYSELANHRVTFMKPKGIKVGLNPIETDWSLDEFDSSNVEDIEDVQEENDTSISDFIDQPGTEKIACQVEVDGKLMYKASIIRQLFTGEGASKDRLRRVQGLSRFAGTSDSDSDLHDMLLVGDPIVVYGLLIPQICITKKILVGNKEQKSIEGPNITKSTTCFLVHESILDDKVGKLVWTGRFKGEPFKVLGNKCQSIKPDLLEDGVEGKYFFDKQLIIDLGVQFTIQSNPNNVPNASTSRKVEETQKQKVIKKKCFICKKFFNKEKMREHVGGHILRGDVDKNDPNICGFCGRNVCRNNLEVSSITHGKPSYKIGGNCSYRENKARAPKQSSVRQPCTNWLIKCAICDAHIWSYMGERHYKFVHPDDACPKFIAQDEINKVIKK